MALPRKSKTQYFMPALFAAIIVGFLSFGIYPQYRELRAVDLEIERLNREISVQKVLSPLHQELKKKSVMKNLDPPMPVKSFLARRDVGRLAEIFKGVARLHGFEMDSVLPRLNTPNETGDQLAVDLSANGNFENLRKFMVALIGLPYLENVEKIEIKRGPRTDLISMRVWLNLR